MLFEGFYREFKFVNSEGKESDVYLADSLPLDDGSNTLNVVTLSGRLSIDSCPECLVRICLTIARPNPVPPTFRDLPLSTL